MNETWKGTPGKKTPKANEDIGHHNSFVLNN